MAQEARLLGEPYGRTSPVVTLSSRSFPCEVGLTTSLLSKQPPCHRRTHDSTANFLDTHPLDAWLLGRADAQVPEAEQEKSTIRLPPETESAALRRDFSPRFRARRDGPDLAVWITWGRQANGFSSPCAGGRRGPLVRGVLPRGSKGGNTKRRARHDRDHRGRDPQPQPTVSRRRVSE